MHFNVYEIPCSGKPHSEKPNTVSPKSGWVHKMVEISMTIWYNMLKYKLEFGGITSEQKI